MGLNLGDLTEAQRLELMKQIKQEEKDKKQKRNDDVKSYNEMGNESVKKIFGYAKIVVDVLTEFKKEGFGEFKSLIGIKEELFNVKDNQRSHTFTSDDGKSVTLGYRVTDSFDDTVGAGIEKVKNWVFSEVKGTNNENIKKIISNMLKEDKKGNLNAKRVLELSQIATDVNDEKLTEAVEIIEKAYKPQKSCYFIELSYKDENGKKVSMPLSVSAAPFENS